MNKRYIYVICIALVLLAVCVTEQIMINKFLGTMENKVASLIEFVGDREDINTNEIYEKVVDMEDTWNGYEGALCFFVNLKDIEVPMQRSVILCGRYGFICRDIRDRAGKSTASTLSRTCYQRHIRDTSGTEQRQNRFAAEDETQMCQGFP
ncbi:MAG: hypothetical protein IJ975_00940 [Clostridia bacterium]|nr:hypothetical protein [Clostridia bacterium]